jgi:cell division protein FtsI/penicillin-binding protein 2
MFSKKNLFIIITFISTLLLSSCSTEGRNQDLSNTKENTEYETKHYNVNLEDISKIQDSLNLFLISTIDEENYIDILDGKYIYNGNNDLSYIFLYNLYNSNNELKTSSNIGFVTISKITCINLVNENPDFTFTEDSLIEFIENDKKSNKSNLDSIKMKTILYNSKENKIYNYMLTFKVKNEIDHEIKIDLLN